MLLQPMAKTARARGSQNQEPLGRFIGSQGYFHVECDAFLNGFDHFYDVFYMVEHLSRRDIENKLTSLLRCSCTIFKATSVGKDVDQVSDKSQYHFMVRGCTSLTACFQ